MKKQALIASLLAFVSSYAMAGKLHIRFGIDPTFAPYESVSPNGSLVGLDVDIGKYICKTLDAQCDWIHMSFDGTIQALKAQKIDAILSGMTITKQREKEVLFSVPMYNVATRLMIPKSSPDLDTTVASLRGKRLGLVQGTTQAAYAEKYFKGKGIDLVFYQNDDLQKQDLSLGRIDAALQDAPAGAIYIDTPAGQNLKLTGTPITDPNVFGNGNGIAVRLGDTELKDKIDGALKKMHEDGTYQKVIDQYTKYGIIPIN